MSMNYRYNKYIDEYIALADAGDVILCKEMKQAIEKVKRDLDDPRVYLDHDKIEKAIEYMEKYFYNMFPWEKFVVALAVGAFIKVDDSDVIDILYDEFFIMMGRGNGKNGFISQLSNYFQTSLHGIKRYSIDIIATSEEQAKTSFIDVWNMLEENTKMRKALYNRTKEEIIFKSTGSYLKYRTNNAKSKDGLRPACLIFDEIHAYENYDNIKVFKSALGKVKQSRTFYITTDGNIRGGVLDDYKAESKDILNGERPRSRMLPLIFKLDNEDEIKDPTLYEKANPSINYLHELKKQILKDVSDSEFREQLKIELYTKRFNLPAENVLTAVASWDNIMATNEELPVLDGFDCIGGIDYASIRDFAGCVLIFKKDGKRFVIHHSFIHHTAYKSIKCKDKIDLAKEKDYCTIVYDETIKPTYISRWFLEQAQKYNILAITCDAFRASILKEEFTACGLPLVECRRGAYTHNKLAPLIEQIFAEKTIKWGDDMLMRWYTNNTYVDTDAKGNKEYKKIEPIMRKTDGFHAFLHALTNDNLLLDAKDLEFFDCYSY